MLIRGIVALLMLAVAIMAFPGPCPVYAEVKGAYLYSLSNFTGTIPYYTPKVLVDRPRNEVYVIYQNLIRVFNENGMEIFNFGDDINRGHVVDAAVNKQGDILLLAYENAHEYAIIKCNYRGETIGSVTLSGFPPEFSGFKPSRFVYLDGKFYLAALGENKIVVTDEKGVFIKGYDVNLLLKDEEEQRSMTDKLMVGFNVDRNGNILLTIPVLFKVYIISPEGKLASFGKVGGPPGRFGIIAGIAGDNRGNYLVADKLKCVIAVFNKDFSFIGEFGYKGDKPGNLWGPDDVAVDARDRVYVGQGGARGVSVFQLIYN